MRSVLEGGMLADADVLACSTAASRRRNRGISYRDPPLIIGVAPGAGSDSSRGLSAQILSDNGGRTSLSAAYGGGG